MSIEGRAGGRHSGGSPRSGLADLDSLVAVPQRRRPTPEGRPAQGGDPDANGGARGVLAPRPRVPPECRSPHAATGGTTAVRHERRTQGWGEVRFFPPAVPLGAVFGGVALQWLWPLEVPIFPGAPLRYWLGGALALVAVLGLGLWSVILFRRSGQSEIPWTPTPSIIESGPYRLTRNPMYLQMVLVCVGLSIAFANV
jgi:hypothetical protein